MDQHEREAHYRCVAGHDIPSEDLEASTEVQRLDRGAEVRVCREHGAPIAISIGPQS